MNNVLSKLLGFGLALNQNLKFLADLKFAKAQVRAAYGRNLKSNPPMTIFRDSRGTGYVKTPRGQVVKWTESKAARIQRAAAMGRKLCNL